MPNYSQIWPKPSEEESTKPSLPWEKRNAEGTQCPDSLKGEGDSKHLLQPCAVQTTGCAAKCSAPTSSLKPDICIIGISTDGNKNTDSHRTHAECTE